MRSLLFVMAVACAAACARCADRVVSVEARDLDGAGADATDVLSSVSVAAGDELSQEALSRDVRALLDTGRFGYAGAEVSRTEGGARVTYAVRRRLRMRGEAAVAGASAMSESKVRKLLGLEAGDYVDGAVLAERAQRVRDEYRKRHRPEARVTAEAAPAGGGYADVTVSVEEGPRRKVRGYAFEGNASVPGPELRASFGDRPWWDPRGWFADDPLTPQALEEARRKAEAVYRARGFLDARVSAPEERDLGGGRSEMVFRVEEGEPCTASSVSVRGVSAFPAPELEGAARGALQPGSPCGTGGLEAAERAVRDYYGDRGYADTRVRATVLPDPGRPGSVSVSLDVREGERCRVRRVVIRGNNVTADRVIRREVLVSPGEEYNEGRAALSERRVRNLGYFERVRHYTENPGDDGARDLVYEVEEKRTGSFMVGAGFSSVDMAVGFAEVQQSNFDILNWPTFTGGGEKARAGVEIGERRQTAEASWTQPWLFGLPVALTLEAHRRMRWYDEWDETRTGGGAGLSYPVALGRVGVRYRLERVDMDDVDKAHWYLDREDMVESTPDDGDWDSRYFRRQKSLYGGNLDSVWRLYWSLDTRDSAFVPRRGVLADVFGEVADGGVGDNEFWRAGLSYRQWVELPWWGHVLSLKGRLETVDSQSGELPVYERLFLGGPRTVRGVEYRDMGPKLYGHEGRRHAAVGGKTLLLVTPEYTVPVFRGVRFAVFSDIGSLSPDEADPEVSDVEVTVGCGLRIDIPGFPIRLDFAKPVKDDDGDTDEEVFSFLIGFE